MNEMSVKLMHPTENKVVDVTVPEDMTVNDIIEEMKGNGWLSSGAPYQAILKDGLDSVELDLNKTLSECGVGENATLRIISGMPGGYQDPVICP